MISDCLLAVEDDPEVLEMLNQFFSARGFQVVTAPDAATALVRVRESLPNLILLDVGLPDFDGFTLHRRLRQSPRTRHIPVIFLTVRARKADRLTGLGMGAVDYMTKPFDLEELYLRVQNAIARSVRQRLADARTGLPSRPLVETALERARGDKTRQAIRFHLRHADAFSDQHGSLAGADLLRYVALLINHALNEFGGPDHFIGQSADDSFVVICEKKQADALVETVISRFDADVEQHYALGRREGDHIWTHDVNGEEVVLPVMQLEASKIPL